MSFAFAGADLLIEVDDDFTITFALGATKGLTPTSDSHLTGKSLKLIVAESDHAYVAALLSGLKPASRCGPVLVRLAMTREDGTPRDALLNACRLPTSPDKINLTLGQVSLTGAMHAASRRNGADGHLLDEGSFTTAAAQLSDAARNLRRPLELTFLDLPELQNPDGAMSKEQTQVLVNRIATMLRAASIDGSTAARLGPARVADQPGAGEPLAVLGVAPGPATRPQEK
jgi:hypothetical protein